jgi:hypothetical protein
MIDTIYSVLQTVLDEAANPIPASNIWNFDETGHNMKFVRTFLYGLRGATKNNSEQCGLGEHVTVGAVANLLGEFLCLEKKKDHFEQSLDARVQKWGRMVFD